MYPEASSNDCGPKGRAAMSTKQETYLADLQQTRRSRDEALALYENALLAGQELVVRGPLALKAEEADREWRLAFERYWGRQPSGGDV
jgi:hypothetical protein